SVLEIMPVADFAGDFGWGYDGVDLFAPSRCYGRPDEFRTFIDTAHALNMGVILDVVYNHVGPDGNYLRQFSPAYFTSRYENEWGEAINFDGPDSGPVREFYIANAAYWIDEYHLTDSGWTRHSRSSIRRNLMSCKTWSNTRERQ